MIRKFIRKNGFSLTLWGNKEIAEEVVRQHPSEFPTIYQKTD